MTPERIVKIHDALDELAGVRFPYKVARQLAVLNRRVNEETAIISTMERDLVKQFGGTVSKLGALRFDSNEAREAFAAAHAAIMQEENEEVSLPMVDLSKYTSMLTLSPSALDALEGIIIFERGDPDGE